MKLSVQLWRVVGATTFAMLVAACSSGSDGINPGEFLGGAAGTDDEAGGAAGKGSAGKGGKGGASGKGGKAGTGQAGDDSEGGGGTDPEGGGSDTEGGGSDTEGGAGTGSAGKGGAAGKAGSGGKAGTGGKSGSGQAGDDTFGGGGTDPEGGGTAGTGTAGTGTAGTGTAGTGTAGTGTAGTGTAGTGTAGTGTAGTGTAGTGTAGTGTAGTGQLCPFPPCDGGGGSAGNGTGGSGPVNCNSKAGEDNDKDGFAFPEDCNDCDPQVNPGAIDILNTDKDGNLLPDDQQVDEDCSGSPKKASEVDACDVGLALGDNDAVKGANAIDICQVSNGKTWGIVSASYVQLDGQPLPAKKSGYTDPALGHGIMSTFGTNVNTQYGANMLVLSTGTARTPSQTGYEKLESFSGNKNYTTTNPAGFPILSESCSKTSGELRDSIALKLRLKAPTNAKSISFKFKFYTTEFSSFVCSSFNDVFIAVMRDKNGNFIKDLPVKFQKTGNIAFDKDGNFLSVNAGFLDVCATNTKDNNGDVHPCPAGTTDLAGTGFEGHGGTSWLQTNAPVVPGEEFELLFGISDAGDGNYNSSVVLDSFKWSAEAGTVSTGRACEQGGTGTCTTCFNDNLVNCCGGQYNACTADGAAFGTGCNGIFTCQNACAGNVACQQSCYNARPAGQAKYNAYQECMFGPAGSTTNFGACGVVCK